MHCDRYCFLLILLATCFASAESKPHGLCVSQPPRDFKDSFLQVVASSSQVIVNGTNALNQSGDAQASKIISGVSSVAVAAQRNNNRQELVKTTLYERMRISANDSSAYRRLNLSTREADLTNVSVAPSNKSLASSKPKVAKSGSEKPKSSSNEHASVDLGKRNFALGYVYGADVGAGKSKKNVSNQSLEEYLRMVDKPTGAFKAQQQNDAEKMNQALEREVSLYSTLKYGIYESLFRPTDWLMYSGALSLFAIACLLHPREDP